MADFTTLEKVKAWSNVSANGDDAEIQEIVTATSLYMGKVIGEDYEGTSILGEVYDPPVSPALVLRRRAVSVERVAVASGDLDPASYALDYGRSIYMVPASQWSGSPRSIEVDYTTSGTVPLDVELAATMASSFITTSFIVCSPVEAPAVMPMRARP